jgi:hypothetical protein
MKWRLAFTKFVSERMTRCTAFFRPRFAADVHGNTASCVLTFGQRDDANMLQEIAAMNTSPMPLDPLVVFQLRFQSLFHEGRALAFPCDSQGRVELDALSDRARENYLYARAVVGREYATPAVMATDLH